jgi:DNA-binding MarR family transcriptional regulator
VARTGPDEDLLEAAREVMRISLHAADGTGALSVVQLRALTVLHRADRLNLAQLAEGLGVTVSTASRLVDRLVTAGLVDRRVAAHTRREIALRLTARGRKTLERYDDLRLSELRRCLGELSDAEQEDAARVLRALATRTRSASAVSSVQ